MARQSIPCTALHAPKSREATHLEIQPCLGVSSIRWAKSSIRCAKSRGGPAEGRHVVVLDAVLLRCITNWRDTSCIRPYAVAIAQGVPERVFDLQRISWHSEGVRNELDRDCLQPDRQTRLEETIASGNVPRLRKDR